MPDYLQPHGFLHARHLFPLSSMEFAKIHVHCVSDAIQAPHPLMSSSLLPSVFPSIRDFSNESVVHIRGPNYWSFSFSISHSSELLGLISLMIDWFDLLVV